MRKRLRSSAPDCTSASPLRKSTGNTQGMRLRIRPPRKARPTMRARPGVDGAGGVTELAGLAELEGAEVSGPPIPDLAYDWAVGTGGPGGMSNSYARPVDSSSTPDRAAGVPVRLASFLRSSVKPFWMGVIFCGAGLSRMFG